MPLSSMQRLSLANNPTLKAS